jgi:hypothetical protein
MSYPSGLSVRLEKQTRGPYYITFFFSDPSSSTTLACDKLSVDCPLSFDPLRLAICTLHLYPAGTLNTRSNTYYFYPGSLKRSQLLLDEILSFIFWFPVSFLRLLFRFSFICCFIYSFTKVLADHLFKILYYHSNLLFLFSFRSFSFFFLAMSHVRPLPCVCLPTSPLAADLRWIYSLILMNYLSFPYLSFFFMCFSSCNSSFLSFYSALPRLTLGSARLYFTRYACSYLQSTGVRCVVTPSSPSLRHSSLTSRRLRPRTFASLPPSSYVNVAYHLVYYPHPVKSSSVRDPACICSLLHNRLHILLLESGHLVIVFACRRCFALLAVYSYTFSLLN